MDAARFELAEAGRRQAEIDSLVSEGNEKPRVTCSMSSVRSAAYGGASAAAPASYNRAVVCTRVRTYHSFLRRFLASQARLRIGWPSSMTSYRRHPRRKVVRGARDPPDPPYTFPVPFRPLA